LLEANLTSGTCIKMIFLWILVALKLLNLSTRMFEDRIFRLSVWLLKVKFKASNMV
jgi:hypothetical protein